MIDDKSEEAAFANRAPIAINASLIAELTQTIQEGENIFTGDSFYRYPAEYRRMEDHMREHIKSGKGDYLVLCVGASSGKNPLSIIMSWEEMVRSINPHYEGTIGVLALELNPAQLLHFIRIAFQFMKVEMNNLIE